MTVTCSFFLGRIPNTFVLIFLVHLNILIRDVDIFVKFCVRSGRRAGRRPAVHLACMQTLTFFGHTLTLSHMKCGAGQFIVLLRPCYISDFLACLFTVEQ